MLEKLNDFTGEDERHVPRRSKRKARALLERLGLAGIRGRLPVFTLRGAKQRVALARAMMIDPGIIGYDEPTSALDPALRLEEVEVNSAKQRTRNDANRCHPRFNLCGKHCGRIINV